MKIFFALIISFFAIPAFADFTLWKGTWKGTCKLNPAYQGVEQFGASLKVGPGSSSERTEWQLIYEASGNLPRQERNYQMVEADKSKGHLILDEHNGLLLDSYLSGQFLYSHFTINRQLITANYILINAGEMIMDLPSFDAKPVRRTCVTGAPHLCTESFGLKSSQRCTFKKVD